MHRVLPALPARGQWLGCCRTPKAEHLQHQAWAEICWYFPDSREQFRIAGRLTVVGDDYPDAELRKVCPHFISATRRLAWQV